MFDPAPEALRLNRIPPTHKTSDMVIGLLQIAHKAKIVPHYTLTDLHYSFTSNLQLRQWAQGNGCPCIDSEGRAITCDNMVLCRTKATLQSSLYSMKQSYRTRSSKVGSWTSLVTG